MPYRRLPNTDAARRKALTKALKSGANYLLLNWLFHKVLFTRVQSFLPLFEKALYETKTSLL
jgi:hypothetical protein